MKTIFFLGMGLLVTAVGFGQTYSAPASSASGINNVFLGSLAGAGASSVSGSNVYVGNQAGRFTNDGIQNVYVGFEAGLHAANSTNTFVGYGAGSESGSDSSCYFGFAAGKQSAGDYNVFIGKSAGYNALGEHNVVIGHSAAGSTDTIVKLGSRNILIGSRSGSSSTGNSNILIGSRAGSTLTSESYRLFIENEYQNDVARSNPLIYGDFSRGSRELKFNAKKVGIGFEGTTGDEGFADFPLLTGLTNANKYRLFVRGGILAEEVRIRLHENWIWPDYVFAKDYNLLSLKDTEKFIAENGHLPNMPSAEKVKAEGVELGNIVTLQQEKIEELTLHLIEQHKQIEELKAQVQLLLNK